MTRGHGEARSSTIRVDVKVDIFPIELYMYTILNGIVHTVLNRNVHAVLNRNIHVHIISDTLMSILEDPKLI